MQDVILFGGFFPHSHPKLDCEERKPVILFSGIAS